MNNKLTILIVLFLLSALPMIFFPLVVIKDGGFSSADIIFIFGTWAGLIGFLFLFWQYLLGVRSVVSLFTKDTILINKIHKTLGIYGILLILSHPILLFVDYLINGGYNVFELAPPTTDYERKVALGKIALTLLLITWASSKLLRSQLTFRWWKRLHYFNYLVLPMVFFHAKDIGAFLRSEPLRLYFNFLLIAFLILIVYRLLGQFGLQKKRYQVISVSAVVNNVVKITLKPLAKVLNPEPGQFQHFMLSALGETHPFTISHFEPETGQISLSVKAIGPYSSSLQQLKPGTIAYIEGPYGVFTQELYQGQIAKVVLIAGGIGITPFLRFADFLKQHPEQFSEAYLFYGNKTTNDIAYKAELEQVSQTTNLQLVHVLSEVKPDRSLPGFETGFIDLALLKKYLKSELPAYHFFICGPPVMMEKVTAALTSQGVPTSQIYKEEFGW